MEDNIGKTTIYNTSECQEKVDRLTEERKHAVLLPTYSIYLISFNILLLIIIVIVLSYLLYKKGKVQNNVIKVSENFNEQRNYSPQASHEGTNYKHKLQNRNDDHQTIHLRELTNCTEVQEPEESQDFRQTQSQISKQLKMHPIGKSKHNMILKDQLFKICQNELTNSQNNGIATSLKDLHMLLQDKNANSTSASEEKFTSTPQLDEYYDELPNTRPITAIRSSTALDIPVYDCLPNHSQNIITTDNDTNYLCPIRKTIDKEESPEPEYTNASYRFQRL